MKKANKNRKTFLDFIFVKSNFIKFIIYLWIIFEVLYVKLGIDVFVYTWKICLTGCGLAVVPVLQETIKEAGKQKDEECEKQGFQSMLDKAKQFVRSLCRLVKQNKFFSFVVTIAMVILIPSASAHYRLFGRVVSVVEDMRYEDTIEENGMEALQFENKTEEGNESKDENEKSLKEKTFLTDVNRNFQLSKEEKNRLYFEEELDNNIDWLNVDTVSEAMAEFVQSLRMEKKSNKFDISAPEQLKGDIATASLLEQNMDNSDDLDSIINTRMDAFYKYPKHALARLLSANQQRYALEYEKINGNPETIEYYYGQSVVWLFEALKFSDVDKYMEKSIIASIKMRYRDIYESAPEGSWSKKRAYILSEAFEKIQNRTELSG